MFAQTPGNKRAQGAELGRMRKLRNGGHLLVGGGDDGLRNSTSRLFSSIGELSKFSSE